MNGAIGDFNSTGHEQGGRVAVDHVDAEIGLIPMTETIRDLESNLPCPTRLSALMMRTSSLTAVCSTSIIPDS